MQYTNTSVFITGATGFIGQHLVRILLEQGHTVRAMVRPEKFPDNRIPAACEQLPVGLTDVDGLIAIVSDCDAVIYGAGSVRGRSPDDFSNANIRGVSAMLAALERVPEAPPLLLVSSLAASRPQLSDYSFSKHAGEQLLLDKPSLAWTILRPPAVYGPGDKEMLPVLKMARRGLLVHAGPKDQRLSLLHVDDLARAVLAWLAAWQQCMHQQYAIDDGQPGGYDWPAIGTAVSGGKYRSIILPRLMLDIAARSNLMAAKLVGYQPMLTPGKVRELVQADWLGDNSNFTAATGWKPKLDLHTGARQLFRTSTQI
jgi:nucleoside-diphosphate-sugar epimerase